MVEVLVVSSVRLAKEQILNRDRRVRVVGLP